VFATVLDSAVSTAGESAEGAIAELLVDRTTEYFFPLPLEYSFLRRRRRMHGVFACCDFIVKDTDIGVVVADAMVETPMWSLSPADEQSSRAPIGLSPS